MLSTENIDQCVICEVIRCLALTNAEMLHHVSGLSLSCAPQIKTHSCINLQPLTLLRLKRHMYVQCDVYLCFPLIADLYTALIANLTAARCAAASVCNVLGRAVPQYSVCCCQWPAAADAAASKFLRTEFSCVCIDRKDVLQVS